MKRRVVSILVAGLFLFAGCGKEKGFRIGFHYDFNPPSIPCAVTSESTEFDADNVVLTFYFAFGELENYQLSDENYDFICFAFYFCNTAFYMQLGYIKDILKDYRKIEGHYFIKEILKDEYVAEEYSFTMKRFRKKQFKHNENFTVPKETMIDKNGSFCMRIIAISYSHRDNGYCMTDSGRVKVDYEYTDEKTVRLSEPSSQS